MGGFLDPWIQCQGTTKDGHQCGRMTSFWGNNYCHSHQSQAPESSPSPITVEKNTVFSMATDLFLTIIAVIALLDDLFESIGVVLLCGMFYWVAFRPLLTLTVIHPDTEEWREFHGE